MALPAGRTPGRPAGSQGDWPGAAEAWLRAAQSAPRTDWQQFARKGLNTATGAAGEGCNEKQPSLLRGFRRLNNA